MVSGIADNYEIFLNFFVISEPFFADIYQIKGDNFFTFSYKPNIEKIL